MPLGAALDLFSLIFILGAAQGVFLALLLSSPPRGSTANRLLAAAMLAFSIDLLTAAYYNLGIQHRFPHFIGVDYMLPFLYGPLIFFYVKAMDSSNGRLRRVDWAQFLPILALAVYLIPFYAQTGAAKLALHQSSATHVWTARLTMINHFKFIYSFGYLIGTFFLLRRHRKRVKDTFSNVEHIALSWLRNFVFGGLAVWTVALVAYVLYMRSDTVSGTGPIEGFDDVVLLAVAIFVYAIGYLGLRQPEIFGPETKRDTGSPPKASGSQPRYARSGLDASSSEQILHDLAALMRTHHPYRNPGLKLNDLAGALSVTTHNLSEAINSRSGQNFYDLVNAFRVGEVKERLDRGDADTQTLLAIAMDAGFNSKSSFNAVFKKHTGMTPSEYRRRSRTTRSSSEV